MKNKEREVQVNLTLLKEIIVSADQSRQGQPKLTEEIEVQRNTNYQMGQPNVKVLEEGKKTSLGKPNSNEEVKVGYTTRRSLGKPSSPKDKNILVNQLIMGVPNSIEELKDKKKRSSGKPNTLKKTMFSQIS